MNSNMHLSFNDLDQMKPNVSKDIQEGACGNNLEAWIVCAQNNTLLLSANHAPGHKGLG